MTLLPEIERELLRVAREPQAELRSEPHAERGRGTAPRAVTRARFLGRVGPALAVLVAVVVGGAMVLLLDHGHRGPSQRGAVTSPARRVATLPQRLPINQPGAWRRGGAGCPLAAPNRYLPARAGCVSVARARVGGRNYAVLLFGTLGTLRWHHLWVPTSFTLEVVRQPGMDPVALRLSGSVRPPTILAVRSVSRGRAIGILLHDGGISSGQEVLVYSFDGHQLRRTGPVFFYSGDSTEMSGITCLRHPDEIVQHVFSAPHSGHSPMTWDRTDTPYRWRGGVLHAAASTSGRERLVGLPPKSLTSVRC